MMNSACPTGILIDISNVDVAIQPASASSKPQNATVLRSKTSHNCSATVSPSVYMKSPGYDSPRMKNPDYLDCELLENVTFDFNDLSRSPNVSGSSDEESTFKACLQYNLPTKPNNLKLNTEQLAEVFKEATVVAVKLENFVQDMNKTPPKSPNLTALLAERSAQKKNASNLRKKMQDQEIKRLDLDLEPEEEKEAKPVLELNLEKELEMEEKHQKKEAEGEEKQDQVISGRNSTPRPEDVSVVPKILDKFGAKNGSFSHPPQCSSLSSSAPIMKNPPATINSSLTSYANFSKALQQNRYRSSSSSTLTSPAKIGPIKATAMPPPRKLPTFNSLPIRKPQCFASSSDIVAAADQRKPSTTLTRTSSFKSAPKIPVRPLLKRRNSMVSPDMLTVRPSSDPRPLNRRSLSVALPSPSASATSSKNIRHASAIPQLSNDARQSRVPIPTTVKSSALPDAAQKLKRPKLH